jgi:FlaA1/EpsC-like NDP-sugar epimerase
MGASKRVCEMIVQSQRDHRYTHFCSVRFGNVLGSRGSVVPIFQQQILRGGPVTVTHPEAQRFLMTISEAVCLLIQAGSLAHTREIFVLDMGKPVLIKQLAEDLIELSGLSPNKDVRIEITQMKPGEKLTEVLVDTTETLQPTCLQKIQTIRTQPFDSVEFANRLRSLEKAAWQSSPEDVYKILASLNIGFPYSATDQPWPGTPQHAVSSPLLARQPAEISIAQLDADPRYS